MVSHCSPEWPGTLPALTSQAICSSPSLGNVRGSALAKVHAGFRCVYLLQERCVYMCVSLCADISVCVCPCACVCFCVYMHVHVCVWVFVDVCLCLSLCTRAQQLIVVNSPCRCLGPYVALPACGPCPYTAQRAPCPNHFPLCLEAR